ncbi:hypothetical protein Q4602_21620 [Paraglaciecola chathamensis]|uniref:hypothetical protein n=1 Tax=Paraglaciecola chathamensis TaxID=368405 RepID=UPI00270AC058|nr:hypothetical protein [Paraglaciecola chathamensis]MDO6842085.1 hypothetical protein [Paraglaciecola chathamensis]
MKGKVLTLSCILFYSAQSFSSELNFESGFGVDYSGLGVKVGLGLTDNIDAFISSGLAYINTEGDVEFGYEGGIKYKLDNKNAIIAFYGVTHIERTLKEDLSHDEERDHGFSVGYKYFFNGHKKNGFNLGATYSFYDGGSYPLVSVGYSF